MADLFNVTEHFVDRNLAEGRGDRTALLHGEGRTSYAELAELVNRVGHVLRDLGVRRGDRVLLALSDGVAFVATWYAVLKIGAVTAEVYTYLHAEDYRYYLDYTGARVVVVDQVTAEAVRAVAGPDLRLLVVGGEAREGEHDWAALVAQAPTALDPAPTTPDDEAIWKFTTGSTGRPKACPHPGRSPLLSFQNYARGVLDLRAEDVVLPVPKLFFGYSRDLAALFPFGVGGAGIVFPERSTPDRIFRLIARHRPTVLVNVPTMMAALVAHPDAARQDLSSLRLTTSAGEALPAELHRRWLSAFGVPVVDGIGSSEAYHIYVSNRPGRAVPGSLGTAVPGYRARVVDADGRELPDGEVGVLEVAGPTLARGYVGAPEQTARTFVDGAVRSGDLFRHDPDGFRYQGRADDLLKVASKWVAPAEVEDCLLGHPAVLECAVVAYQDQGLTLPRAVVVPRPGVEVSDALADELRDHVRAALAPHKYPRQVRFADQLPRTASGKLDRRALRTPGEVGPGGVGP